MLVGLLTEDSFLLKLEKKNHQILEDILANFVRFQIKFLKKISKNIILL